MQKRKLLSILTLICYLACTLAGAIVGISAFYRIEVNKQQADGDIGLGFAALGLAIIGILAFAYAIITLIPSVLKAFDVFFEKNGLTVACIIFDIILILIHAFMVYSSISGSAELTPGGIILLAASFVIWVLTLVLNIFTLKA